MATEPAQRRKPNMLQCAYTAREAAVETDPTWDAVRADLIAILAGLAWRKRRCDGLLAEFRNELRRSPGSHTEIAPQARRVVVEQAEAIARCVEIERFLRQMVPFT